MPFRSHLIIVAICSQMTIGQVFAEDKVSGIHELMSQEEYEAAGLNKLTEEERRVLNRWLREHFRQLPEPARETPPVAETRTASDTRPDAEAPEVNANESFGLPAKEQPVEAQELTARVLPPFRGWSGKTVFRLDNGQKWRQRVSGRFTYTGDDTRVVISKNGWGFYEMRLLVADRSVGVTRVK